MRERLPEFAIAATRREQLSTALLQCIEIIDGRVAVQTLEDQLLPWTARHRIYFGFDASRHDYRPYLRGAPRPWRGRRGRRAVIPTSFPRERNERSRFWAPILDPLERSAQYARNHLSRQSGLANLAVAPPALLAKALGVPGSASDKVPHLV